MTSTTILSKESSRKGLLIQSSTIVLIAFFTLFFSRCLDTLGAPAPINFLHFISVPFALYVVATKSRFKSVQQNETVLLLIVGVLALVAIITLSALWNSAGIINAILSFLLLGEPFLMLMAIMMLPVGTEGLQRLTLWLHRSVFFHLGLAMVQQYVFKMHTWTGRGLIHGDHIQGVFYKSGAGHVVGASVSLSFGLYYFLNAKNSALWQRCLVLAVAFWHVLLADAKQVLFCFMVSAVLLLISKSANVIRAIQYLVVGSILGSIFWWCIQNVEAFEAYTVWIRPEIYGPEGNATIAKTMAFRVLPDYFSSPVNWLVGLGPGHTVGRLGGWMIHEYDSLLSPLGSTIQETNFAVWVAVGASRKTLHLVQSSSMFSPLFGWAGIWGDLGLLGLATYLGLGCIIWKFICVNDLSKFFLLNVLVFGLIFTQMEEPAYTVTIGILIGLQWHHKQAEKKATASNLYPSEDKKTTTLKP
ncbi:MAG: hypothetical protein AAF821_10160 [Cyanobacteria bacterium P01_D01_bin.156]